MPRILRRFLCLLALLPAVARAETFAQGSGDTISGKQPGHKKKMKGEYDQFLGIVASAGVPVFAAPVTVGKLP